MPLTSSKLPSRPAGRGFQKLAEGRKRAVVVEAPVVDDERDVLVDRRRLALLDDSRADSPRSVGSAGAPSTSGRMMKVPASGGVKR